LYNKSIQFKTLKRKSMRCML